MKTPAAGSQWRLFYNVGNINNLDRLEVRAVVDDGIIVYRCMAHVDGEYNYRYQMVDVHWWDSMRSYLELLSPLAESEWIDCARRLDEKIQTRHAEWIEKQMADD